MYKLNKKIAYLLLILFLLLQSNIQSIASPPFPKPRIQHATTYKPVVDLSEYWVSEKLDGMRGYWNGEQLLSRQGNIINSPKWFTKNWPKNPMDGELWIARGQFQKTLSCVRKVTVEENCWRKVRFMVFDLPKHTGTFTERITTMKVLANATMSSYLEIIKQFKIDNTKQLDKTLNHVITNQGEGLMLHRDNAYYSAGRTNNIMKLKKHQDAEAIVIAHVSGKGKYQDMLGALKVQTKAGITFKIGSGFSDKERANPPKVGSIITYKYNGKTDTGIPRFARFYRLRSTE
jgi:DNA ligase-1